MDRSTVNALGKEGALLASLAGSARKALEAMLYLCLAAVHDEGTRTQALDLFSKVRGEITRLAARAPEYQDMVARHGRAR